MRYFSTRCSDNVYGYSFKHILFSSLSENGGLYIPETIPGIIVNKTMNFYDIAYLVFRSYIDELEIDNDALYDIIKRSFETYRNDNITPIVELKNSHINILELFWGPTYSFKDIALGVIGNLFEYFLTNNINEYARRSIHVICATSGDTGSAAIHSLRNKRGIQCSVLHPNNKISDIQKQQMTTVLDTNITNIAIDGTFDDCQRIVKRLLYNFDYVSVNSINWARIMTQIIYYFHSYVQYLNQNDLKWGTKIDFSVPTGNFGNILAGYYAKQMGLPVKKLIIATNSNDTLYKFLQTGVYKSESVKQTSSPAMDIALPSNFERLLYYATIQCNNSREDTCALINFQMRQKTFQVSKRILEEIKQDFVCQTTNDIETGYIIQKIYNLDKYIIDPHTAVGISAYYKYKYKYKKFDENGLNEIFNTMSLNEYENKNDIIDVICLSTAHPGKFADTVSKYINHSNFIPNELIELKSLPQKYEIVENSVESVLLYI